MFMRTPYFISDEQGWRLKPGAPQDVIDDYEEFMRDDLSPIFDIAEPTDT
ncbi:MAG TPA: hypothetical protein VFC84_14770 [Desulfosporosinus sp.]|nr:hypothetical protein [Desulfosporosinus sp.]